MSETNGIKLSRVGELVLTIVGVPLGLAMGLAAMAWIFLLPAVGFLWMVGWLR